MPNIIGGKYKRIKLDIPINFVRPTSALKREAIFSIMESYSIKHSIEIYKNKSIIDLFAGSGLIGLEAISRGMQKSYFIENNNNVIKILENNCKKICKKKQYEIFFGKAINVLSFKPSQDINSIVKNLELNLEKYRDFRNSDYYNIQVIKKLN